VPDAVLLTAAQDLGDAQQRRLDDVVAAGGERGGADARHGAHEHGADPLELVACRPPGVMVDGNGLAR